MLMEGVQLHPGLNSPGPIYQLPGSFEKAAARSKHPIWGHHGPHSLKQGRFRCEEVRFMGKRHMREMQGHFSPGPQYNLPSFVGGSVGNFVASNNRLANTAPANGGRVKLSASDLGGAPSFTLTQGSFSDSKRLRDFEPKETGAAFWRGATMLQPAEPNLVNSSPRCAHAFGLHPSALSVRGHTTPRPNGTALTAWRESPVERQRDCGERTRRELSARDVARWQARPDAVVARGEGHAA